MNGISEVAFPAEMEALNLEGAPAGNGGQALLDADGDFRALRPWKDPTTNTCFIDITNEQGENDVLQVANATLRKDEWEMYDKAVQEAARDNLVGIEDLERNNMTFDIGDGLGIFQLTYEERTALQEAFMDMTGENRGEAGDVNYTQKFLPIPLIYSHFRINLRRLMASRRGSEPLDDVLAQESTTNINEKMEDLLFGSSTYSYGGATIQTYLTHPSRITDSASGASHDWGTASVDEIISDVRSMKQIQLNKRHRGPWMLYVPSELDTRLDEDYSTAGGSRMTLYQRLTAIRGIQDVKPVDRLANGNALLVEMKKSNVRLVRGMDLNPVQWSSPSGMAAYFQVMTIRVPQIRVDANGNLGVTHHTWSV